jgi:hypothetical protein
VAVAAVGVAVGVEFGVAVGVEFGVAVIISALRFEDWFLGSILGNHGLNTFHSTFLPKATISSQIKQWLRKDWSKGIDNINQLLEFTLQFIPVINSLNTVLAEIPEQQLIYRISQIAENLYDWKVLKYCAASLANELKALAIEGFFFFLPYRYLTQLQSHISTDIRLDTPPRAVAAGFWYLHEEEPQKATEAFEKVRTLLYGEEMYQLASILTDLRGTTDTKTIASLNLPSFPNAPLLRPITWQALTRLRQVKEDIALTLNPQESRLVRNSSLNRATGELKGIINEKAILPEAERALILHIAQNWLNAVESIALEIGSLTITEPIPNPYIIGDPVEGQLFVGREDIFQKMKEIWSNPSHIQSMVLYGHRRMGKTSILRNVNQKIGQNLRLGYLNLQSVGSANQGVSDILMAISDAIAETLEIEPPNRQDLLDLPERTFENYLKQILREMPYQGLIIALDEFEELETLINEGAIHSTFIKVLRSWIQMNPKLGFILAGLHTLDEMSRDYFSPFFSGFGESLRITFLSPASTRQLLTEPTEDFALRYDRTSVEYIHELTYGQAYLVNLIGFRLVSRFNRLRFEQNSEINDIITRDDVDAVVTDEILQRATYYFEGVWNQAAKGAPRQQDILQALAEYTEGREKEELQQELGIENQDLDRAIATLKHHDVIGEDGTKIKILVELFRRWLLRS